MRVEIVGIIALLVFLVFATLAVVAAVKTVRAVKRGVERRTEQARRLVEDQRLRARRFTAPGPAGEIARLRLELRASIDGAYRALAQDGDKDASLSEAASLLDRLNEHARALDGDLRLMEREPDAARLAARLPELSDRTHRVTGSADALRRAAQERASHFADDELASLTRDIDLEAGALRHWERPAAPPGPAAPGGSLKGGPDGPVPPVPPPGRGRPLLDE